LASGYWSEQRGRIKRTALAGVRGRVSPKPKCLTATGAEGSTLLTGFVGIRVVLVVRVANREASDGGLAAMVTSAIVMVGNRMVVAVVFEIGGEIEPPSGPLTTGVRRT
jgi:hypothetical protein